MPPPAHTPVAPPRAAPPPPTLPDELLQLVASLANRLNDLESHQLPELSHAHDRSLHDQLANDARRELGGVKRDVEVSFCALYTAEARRRKRRQAPLVGPPKLTFSFTIPNWIHFHQTGTQITS